MHTEEIEYKDGDTVCRGFLAHNPDDSAPKPCVLIAHDWSGRSQVFCDKAKQWADKGYVGFAIDMYGDARTGTNKVENQALLSPIMEQRSRIVHRRMLAAYHAIANRPEVNAQKIAAIGYCFGGLCVLDLARIGAEISGVVSFHGLLFPPDVAVCKKIRSKILVLHGYDDPLVPPKQVHDFASEMSEKKVDWQIHMYGNTQHSFTNPAAHDDEMGLHYHPTADYRSALSADDFLEELFK